VKSVSPAAGRSGSGSDSDSGTTETPEITGNRDRAIARKPTVPRNISPHNSTSLYGGGATENGFKPYIPPAASVPPQVVSSLVKQCFTEMTDGDDKFRSEILSICKEVLNEELQKMRNELTTISTKRTANNSKEEATKSPLESIKDPQVRELIAKTFPGCLISTWTHNDITGAVSGKPGAPVSVDVIHYQDDKRWLLDMKEHIGPEVVAHLLRIGKIYHQTNPKVSLACVVVSASVDPNVAPLLDKCKIKHLKLQ